MSGSKKKTKFMREAEAAIKREGFTIERTRRCHGSHFVYYLRHQSGATTTEILTLTKGDPRGFMNMTARLRRVAAARESPGL
ncbi:hypothetical protein UFOVP1040_14 [uncultured Caudovirales phage]|uniref:Uncharacterized protein n=1 Tax=uncultured Caudovirales phage TaxID=2100421 RepID=A0A6J5QFI0_9CAUD|nr:hypothetical protein UFOVP1040_14 [uncultured Caudovirales phage]